MADHLILFYFILTFSIGIFSLGIVSVISVKTKNVLLKYYLYFYAVFSVFIGINMFFSYVAANAAALQPERTIFAGILYANVIIMHAILFTFPLFAHELFDSPHRARRNRVVAYLSVCGYLWYHLQIFIGLFWKRPLFDVLKYLFLNVLLAGTILYCLMLSIQYYQRRQTYLQARNGILFLIFFAGIFAIIAENLLFNTIHFPFYPLIYAICGLMFCAYFVALYWPKEYAANATSMRHLSEQSGMEENLSEGSQVIFSGEMTSIDAFCARFQISVREREVLLLLLQGHTSSQIGERLFISVNTAKTHISKIYQKVGVKRRYELLARCRDFSHENPQ